MKLKFLQLVLLVILSSVTSQSQNIKSDYYENATPNKPKSSALGNFGGVPINYYTGLPEISLNLFTLTSRDLSLPISLNYDASGVRTDDISGPVGIKWNLDAGGFISRELVGRPDEDPNEGYWKYALSTDYYQNLSSIPDWVNWTEKNERDRGPDEFVLNISGRSIRFVFDKNKNIVPVPRQNVKITYTLSSNKITQFVLITEDGTRYVFGGDNNAIEETKHESLNVNISYNQHDGFYINDGSYEGDLNDWTDGDCAPRTDWFLKSNLKLNYYEMSTIDSSPVAFFYNSKWYLTSIISPTGDNISFSYTKSGSVTYPNRPYSYRAKGKLVQMDSYNWSRDTHTQVFFWCNYSSTLNFSRSNTTLAFAKFPTSFAGSDPSYEVNISQTNTDQYFLPEDYAPDVGSVAVAHSLVTQSNIWLNQITTSVGNKLIFLPTTRDDLPNGMKYSTIQLKDFNNVLIKSINLNYSTVSRQFQNGVVEDPFWASEAAMAGKIIPSPTGQLQAYRVDNAGSVSVAPPLGGYSNLDPSTMGFNQGANALFLKYVYEGLKAYNYKRTFLMSISETTQDKVTIPYVFTYYNADKLTRRTTPLHSAYGYARTTINPTSWLWTGGSALYTNGDVPNEDLHSGNQPGYGLLTSIKYITGGTTTFTYGGTIGPKLTSVNPSGDPQSLRTLQYISPVQNQAPKFTNVQDTKVTDEYGGLLGWIKYDILTSNPQNEAYSFTRGAHEGHQQVKVYYGSVSDNKGYELFTFHSANENDYKDSPTLIQASPADPTGNVIQDIFPFPKPYEIDYFRGLVKNHKIYTSNNELLKETENSYILNPGGHTPTQVFGLKTGKFVGELGRGNKFMYGTQPTSNQKYRYARYKITADWVVLDNSIEKTYDQTAPQDLNKFVGTTKKFYYDQSNLQLTKTESFNSLNTNYKIVNQTKYVTHPDYNNSAVATDCYQTFDQCITNCNGNQSCINTCYQNYYNCTSVDLTQSLAINELMSKHQIATPVEVQNMVEDNGQTTVTSAVVHKYAAMGSSSVFVKPISVLGFSQAVDPVNYQTSKMASDGSFTFDPRARTLHSFNSYDPSNGNILQQTTLDGMVVSQQWGFNGTLVTSSTINPGSQQQLSSYDHYPLIGVKSITDPNARNSYFEYGFLNNLKLEKDHNGNITNRYRYQLEGRTFSSTITASGSMVAGSPVTLSTNDNLIDYGQSTYTWYYGDGTQFVGGSSVNKTYNSSGTYTITLTKSNPEYPSITIRKTIVINTPGLLSVCADGPVIIDQGASSYSYGDCTQPANQNSNATTYLNATFSGGCSVSPQVFNWDYQIDYGNWVAMGSGQQVQAPAGFLYRTPGTYTVRCRFVDGCGTESTSSVTLTIHQ